ncbi:MAG: hypothetical protein Q8936_20345 [Bacillota bacterium]|nr:hypothetical protein [Bacillota bacterium]
MFLGERGSGKTKALIGTANEKVSSTAGSMVYITFSNRPLLAIDRGIRFISTQDYGHMDYSRFYGFLCGVLSQDYDIESVFIDDLFCIVEGNLSEAAHLFSCLENLAQKNNIEIYININCTQEGVPEYMKKYSESFVAV